MKKFFKSSDLIQKVKFVFPYVKRNKSICCEYMCDIENEWERERGEWERDRRKREISF